MKTKIPVALVYGWYKEGTFDLLSNVYYWENLQEYVKVFSKSDITNLKQDFVETDPDVIVIFHSDMVTNIESVNKRIVHVEDMVEDSILANIVVCQTTFRNSTKISPKFSIFTPTFKTGDRIYRTYEGLKNQTYPDWEWVIVDDSPDDDDTYSKLVELAKTDHRVKPYKITPISGGIVGMAKNRACHLSEGDWLVELDHDDYLLPNCLEELMKASETYPDAGFMYSEVCELYDDGEMKFYTSFWGDDGYANPQNNFNCAYGIHYWVDNKYLSHRYSDINPLSIRYNFTMPNHVRCWKRDVYFKLGGHNKRLPVADDFELIVKTFLETRIVHVKKLLYLQYNNNNSTVDNNVIDINRRARLIKDHFDLKIHNRIQELGKKDWMWDYESKRSYLSYSDKLKYYEEEQVMNYIYL